MKKFILIIAALFWAGASFAQPVTTQPPINMIVSPCTTVQLLYGGGNGLSPQCLNLGTNLSITTGTLNAAGGGSGSPGGSNTQVQYNNSGAFGGITGATTNGTALTLVAPVLGTPASVVLTNATGLPISTGVSGLGTNVATFLATPSSANLRGALTDETGTGLAYFQGGDIGTPSAGVGTNLTALNASNLSSGTVAAARGGAGTITGALKGNGAGVVTQAACADLSNGTALCSTAPGTGVASALAANLSAAGGVSSTVVSGTSALGTGAISSATCATVITTAATNAATTDVIWWGFNGDPTAVTGYVPLTSGMLTIIAYPSANNVNFKVCNNTSSSITPGAITLNWRVVR